MGDLVDRLMDKEARAECSGYGLIKDSECGNSRLLDEAAARIATLEAEKARLVEHLALGAGHENGEDRDEWRERARNLLNELGVE